MNTKFVKSLFYAACISALTLFPASAKRGKPVAVKTITIESFLATKPEQKKFGQLTFLGGMELQSDHKDFGGISGIRLLENAKSFLAITDQGRWISGNIDREGLKPKTLSKVRMGRLRKANGKKLKGKKNADAEGLEILGNSSEFLISFERNHRIERYSWIDDRLQQVSGLQTIDLNSYKLENNHGPEAIAFSPATNQLYVFPEGDAIDSTHYRGFMLHNNEISTIRIKRRGDYRMTDAAFSDTGDLFLLERDFSLIFGVSARIRKFSEAELHTTNTLSGEVIFEAGWSHEIDNMEGLSLSTLEDGSTRLTLISDDNFSGRQRTLLLEFQLPMKTTE